MTPLVTSWMSMGMLWERITHDSKSLRIFCMKGTKMGVRDLILSEGDLGRLVECLLIEYVLDRARREFVVVSDYWEKQAPGQRSFLKLVFAGVEEFKREPGVNSALRAYWSEYRLKGAAPGGMVFQSIEILPAETGRRANIWLGPAFGGCSFVFERVRASVRSAHVEMRGGEWEYRDAISNEVLDFFAPFDPEA
jgi:hypothetical protein